MSGPLLLQGERFYKNAHAAKKPALQPFHGLVQLYRRSGAYGQQSDALRHILSHSSTDEVTRQNTRIELATALLKSKQAEEAWQVLVAIEDRLQSAVGFGEPFEVPHEIALLKADCQMMLDEAEYNSRLRHTLAEAHNGSNSADRTEDDDLLTQRVAATWVRLPYHRQHTLQMQRTQPRPPPPQKFASPTTCTPSPKFPVRQATPTSVTPFCTRQRSMATAAPCHQREHSAAGTPVQAQQMPL